MISEETQPLLNLLISYLGRTQTVYTPFLAGVNLSFRFLSFLQGGQRYVLLLKTAQDDCGVIKEIQTNQFVFCAYSRIITCEAWPFCRIDNALWRSGLLHLCWLFARLLLLVQDTKISSLERNIRDLEDEVQMLKTSGLLHPYDRQDELKQVEVYKSHSKFMKSKVECLRTPCETTFHCMNQVMHVCPETSVMTALASCLSTLHVHGEACMSVVESWWSASYGTLWLLAAFSLHDPPTLDEYIFIFRVRFLVSSLLPMKYWLALPTMPVWWPGIVLLSHLWRLTVLRELLPYRLAVHRVCLLPSAGRKTFKRPY